MQSTSATDPGSCHVPARTSCLHESGARGRERRRQRNDPGREKDNNLDGKKGRTVDGTKGTIHPSKESRCPLFIHVRSGYEIFFVPAA
jgi:hypothetical protein